MTTLSYGFKKMLPNTAFQDARAKLTDALQSEGFGVLTEIDVKATLQKKLDVGFRRYVILGACNPSLAHRALEAEPHIGLLLPCNVVLQETSGGIEVSIASPKKMFTIVDNTDVAPVAEEAEKRLKRAIDSL